MKLGVQPLVPGLQTLPYRQISITTASEGPTRFSSDYLTRDAADQPETFVRNLSAGLQNLPVGSVITESLYIDGKNRIY